MSHRTPSPEGSLKLAAPATLWAGSYCARCPATAACLFESTDEACGEPAQYRTNVLHPSTLVHPASSEAFDFERFTSTDRTGSLPRPPLLTISDGSLTPTVRLKEALSAIHHDKSDVYPEGVAVLHGKDRHLRRLLGHRGHLGFRLGQAGFVGVIAPGFSTWAHHAPYESMVAQAVTTRLAVEVDRHLPVVPTIVWRAHEELDRWVQWLVESRRTSAAVHSGPLRLASEWAWWCRGIERLNTRFEIEGLSMPHLYVNGAGTPQRLADVLDIWGLGVTFMMQHPFVTAVKHRELDDDFARIPDSTERSSEDLLGYNHAKIEAFIRREITDRRNTRARRSA